MSDTYNRSMEMLSAYLDQLSVYWNQLDYSLRYNLWIASGVLGLILWAWISHRIIRKALGYRKFRGAWLNEEQFQELIYILDEDLQSGRRVMQHDETDLLNEWKYGGKIKNLYGKARHGYW